MQEFTGLDWMYVSLANAYGHDKLSWDKRLSWGKKLHKQHLDIDDADEPLLFSKTVHAIDDVLNNKPTGYVMGLDCTASGLQIISALMGCKKTGMRVNTVDTGVRQDAYQFVANKMNKDYGCNVTRKELKTPIMTTFYNSKAKPKEIFGDGTPELKAFYQVLHDEFPGAMEYLQIVQGCWNPHALEHSWTLPDGIKAQCKVMQHEDKKVEVQELGKATYTYRTLVNKADKYGLSLPANIVQSVDGYIVRRMITGAKELGFDLFCIFDSFWCSPNHVGKMTHLFRCILAEIADSDLMESILNEITGYNGTFIKEDDIGQEIRNSTYALS